MIHAETPLFSAISFLQKLTPETLPPLGWWLVAGGGWLVAGGWLAGGWWLVGLGWLVAGGWRLDGLGWLVWWLVNRFRYFTWISEHSAPQTP